MHYFPLVAEQVRYNSDRYYGSWSYMRPDWYACSGSEMSLSSCNFHHYSYCYTHDNQAGVQCTGPLGSVCSQDGDVRLFGGNNDNEGIVEYCYAGAWSSFCSFQLQDAIVTCKQLGHYQNPCASFIIRQPFLLKQILPIVIKSSTQLLLILSLYCRGLYFKSRNFLIQY